MATLKRQFKPKRIFHVAGAKPGAEFVLHASSFDSDQRTGLVRAAEPAGKRRSEQRTLVKPPPPLATAV